VSSLDLWDEMRAALAVHAGRLSPEEVLRMATLGSACALDLGDRTGSLDVGKTADLIAVAGDGISDTDPIGSLIATTRGEDILMTLVDGELRHRHPEGVPCA
jgi:cytosine/adenosine deaminase-related metal-dependent hydrolase